MTNDELLDRLLNHKASQSLDPVAAESEFCRVKVGARRRRMRRRLQLVACIAATAFAAASVSIWQLGGERRSQTASGQDGVSPFTCSSPATVSAENPAVSARRGSKSAINLTIPLLVVLRPTGTVSEIKVVLATGGSMPFGGLPSSLPSDFPSLQDGFSPQNTLASETFTVSQVGTSTIVFSDSDVNSGIYELLYSITYDRSCGSGVEVFGSLGTVAVSSGSPMTARIRH